MKNRIGSRLEGYTYYAFISYKHQDVKWAVWLQKKLQSYRLPRHIRKKYPELPVRLSPVFLDKTNLTPGILDDGLMDEVQASRYLIVICSRSACQESKYLDDEIGYFLDGGADPSRIIPFIIDPSGQPEADCFPARLQELCRMKSILGANIFDNGKRSALLKVIACMQGLKLEEIESDDRRRRKRTAAWSAAGAVLLLSAISAGIWRYWDYYVPKTAYFLDYAERYGVPVGIRELSEEEAFRAEEHYVIVSSQGKVRELRHENGYGLVCDPEETEDLDRPAKAVYEYEEDGSLHKVTRFNEKDAAVLVMSYVNESTVDLTQYRDEDDYVGSAFLQSHMTANGSLMNQDGRQNNTGASSSIVRYLIDYNEDGFVREIRYAGNPVYNLAAADADGIGGVRYARDEKGRPIRLQYLANVGSSRSAAAPEEYEPTGSRGGIFEICFQYDDQDNLTEEMYLGEDGRPIRDVWNIAVESREYDDSHNLIRSTFSDETGQITESTEGCAVIERVRNAHGCITEESYLDSGGEKTEVVYGYCRITREIDEKGNVVKESYYDLDGNLTEDVTGAAMQTMAYDSAGRKTETWKYGKDGSLVKNVNGISGIRTEYDDRGNPVKICWFGPDRNLVLSAENTAVMVQQFDEEGRVVLCSCYGTDEEPIVNAYGYVQMAWEYDSRGNLAVLRYLDADGNPMLNGEGLSVVEKDYDERGRVTAIRYFGTEGEPVLSYEGFASLKSEYDEYGNLCAESYFGTDGNPIENIYGIAHTELEYDARTNITEQRIYGPDGEPSENVSGWSVRRAEYNSLGEITAIAFYAADGALLYEESAQGESGDVSESGRRIF